MFVNQELVKITSKYERARNEDHLSSDLKLMRRSINRIFISNIFPFNFKSIFFLMALVMIIFKTLID